MRIYVDIVEYFHNDNRILNNTIPRFVSYFQKNESKIRESGINQIFVQQSVDEATIELLLIN